MSSASNLIEGDCAFFVILLQHRIITTASVLFIIQAFSTINIQPFCKNNNTTMEILFLVSGQSLL